MNDQDARAKLMAAARFLILKGADHFSIAALCKETGLTREEMRRHFPTKASLIVAILDASPPKSKLGLQEVLQESEIDLDDLLESLVRIFEPALLGLEDRAETTARKHSAAAIASLQQGSTGEQRPAATALMDLSCVPPPKITGHHTFTRNLETASGPGSGSQPSTESEFSASAKASVHSLQPRQRRCIEIQDIFRSSRVFASVAGGLALRPQVPALRLMVGSAAAAAVLMFVGAIICFGGPANATLEESGQGSVYGKYSVDAHDGARAPSFLQDPLAIRRITERAEKGDPHAQTELSEDFLRGDGVKADPAAALRWSQEAAAHGEPRAQYILGELYAEGLKPNPDRAFQWFAAAASQGNVKAMHNLAIAFLNGAGVAKNPSTAVYWFTKAAKTGYRDSAFDLGVLYERGEGGSQNPHEALKWYDTAASLGDQQAAQRAALLRSQLLQIAQK